MQPPLQEPPWLCAPQPPQIPDPQSAEWQGICCLQSNHINLTPSFQQSSCHKGGTLGKVYPCFPHLKSLCQERKERHGELWAGERIVDGRHWILGVRFSTAFLHGNSASPLCAVPACTSQPQRTLMTSLHIEPIIFYFLTLKWVFIFIK